jgi:hypothetical protein
MGSEWNEGGALPYSSTNPKGLARAPPRVQLLGFVTVAPLLLYFVPMVWFACMQDEPKNEHNAQKLRTFCNGDIRSRRCVHICDGCCANEAESKENVFLALVDNGVLLGKSGLPSKNKWGTMSAANAKIATGLMLYGVLPRAFRAAFPSYDSAADGLELPEDPLEEDYQVPGPETLCLRRAAIQHRKVLETFVCFFVVWFSHPLSSSHGC